MRDPEDERCGYESLDHTADLALRVWAPSLRELIEQASAGFIGLMVDPETVEPEREAALAVTGEAPEELLVGWLNEILFAFDAEGLAPVRAVVDAVGAGEVRGRLFGQDFDPLRHEVRNVIKAVTYHDLVVRPSAGRLEVSIVFDV
ncbi:MAG: archease [Candidatus Brocadiaceae bacterium]|nr:archease [Candidatus Brocadiaceae bacterium]